jgi:sec-independent protein translocase protein TatB
MFGIGMPELLLILAVALIVIGPKKLPDLAKSLGRAMGEFKRATNDLKQSIEQETGLDEVRQSMKEVKQDLRRSFDDIDTRPLGASGAAPAGTKEPTPEEIALAKLEKASDETAGEAGSKTVDGSPAKSGEGDAR